MDHHNIKWRDELVIFEEIGLLTSVLCCIKSQRGTEKNCNNMKQNIESRNEGCFLCEQVQTTNISENKFIDIRNREQRFVMLSGSSVRRFYLVKIFACSTLVWSSRHTVCHFVFIMHRLPDNGKQGILSCHA